MLGLEAEGVAAVINLASFAANPIQKVAGIKLEAGFGSRHFEQASGTRIISLRRSTLAVGFRYTCRKGVLWSTCKCLAAAWILVFSLLAAPQKGQPRENRGVAPSVAPSRMFQATTMSDTAGLYLNSRGHS